MDLEKLAANNDPITQQMEMKMGLFSNDRGIIIAADVSSLDVLKDLATIGSEIPQVVGIKIGFSLALRFGLSEVVKSTREYCSLPLIYDHQKAATDIPGMGHPFAEICKEAGIEGVIFFPQAGPKTLEAFVTGAIDYEIAPIVGLTMTHPAYLQSNGGFIRSDAPMEIAKISLGLGVQSFVLPGNQPALAAELCTELLSEHEPVEIMMPGIGTQGGSIQRALKSVVNHKFFAIIGSAIYKAKDPLNALCKFAEEMES